MPKVLVHLVASETVCHHFHTASFQWGEAALTQPLDKWEYRELRAAARQFVQALSVPGNVFLPTYFNVEHNMQEEDLLYNSSGIRMNYPPVKMIQKSP